MTNIVADAKTSLSISYLCTELYLRFFNLHESGRTYISNLHEIRRQLDLHFHDKFVGDIFPETK